MKSFAKLFETKEYGQILIMLDTGEDAAPEVRFSFTPANLGICSIALQFKDTDEGWDKAEEAFNGFDSEEKAIEAVKPTIEKFNNHFAVAT